jgi:transcriptional regulator with XRE-family HTH domain
MAKNTKKTTIKSGFPERLRMLRMQKGLSQIDLAKLAKVNSNHISRYERGESKPTAKYLKILAECLEVSTDYLYDGTEKDAAVADFEDREFLKIFKEAESLEEKDKEILKVVIESFLARKKIKDMVS